MTFNPIRAKLYRPPAGHTALPLLNLLRRLDQGLASKVTLVSAPAGFGKSTLVSLWLDQLAAPAMRVAAPLTAPSALKTCWLSLEAADNQLPRFVRYLTFAIEEQLPHSCAAAIELLHEKEPPSLEILADVLADGLLRLPVRLIVVLDDLHLVDDAGVYAFLSRLIQHTTDRLHLVLITRVDPPLPLNRWRAQAEVHELRLLDLGFTLEETTAFLGKNLEQMPDSSVIAKLHERTEGWVVGLRLAALALRGERDHTEFAANIEAANSRYIVDYLVDDVLEQQPPEVQKFLISTAILTHFCAGLSAAVVEIDERATQRLIRHIARANLFLIELSTPRHWYRYHHQFQGMLLSRLHERYDQQAIATLHRQAAAWLAGHGQVDEALHHLTAIADFAAAADLIEAQRVTTLNEQRFHELEEWLAVIPGALLQQRPALLISLAWVQHHRLENAQCLATVQRAAALLPKQAATLPAVTQQLLQAELVALRVALDNSLDPRESLPLIKVTWTQLRRQLNFTHSNVVVWLAATSHRLGQDELALTILLTTFEQTSDWPQMARCRLLYSSGIFYWYNCQPAQAADAFQQGLLLARHDNLYLAATLCHFGLAVIGSLRNQHELAEAHHTQVVNEPYFQNGLRAVLSAYSLIGIYVRHARPEEGRSLVARLKAHALIRGQPYLIEQVAALEAYLALIGGDLAAALRWSLTAPRREMALPEDRVPLIHAQILLAEGSPTSLDDACHLLQTLTERHESERRWSLWLDTSILLALAWAKLGQMEAALAVLGRAVQLGVPNGAVGPFFEQGPAIEPLLHELGQQVEHAPQIRLLLTAFPGGRTPAAPAPVGPVQPWSEPLTERELEILGLLAGRLSNKEIAQQLIVSTHTVRNHIVNIFGKLQAEKRVQAVERARALGLLPPRAQA